MGRNLNGSTVLKRRTVVAECGGGDAKFISSAPDMFYALEHCVAYFEKYRPEGCGVADDRECSPYNDAVQAIKKAVGAK